MNVAETKTITAFCLDVMIGDSSYLRSKADEVIKMTLDSLQENKICLTSDQWAEYLRMQDTAETATVYMESVEGDLQTYYSSLHDTAKYLPGAELTEEADNAISGIQNIVDELFRILREWGLADG